MRSYLPILAILCLISGCGVDTQPLIAESDKQMSAFEANIASGSWSEASTAYLGVCSPLEQHPDAKTDAGQTLQQMCETRKATCADLVRQALPRLANAADREQLKIADQLIDTIAQDQLSHDWTSGLRVEVEQRLIAAENFAKVEAERKRAADLAGGYVLIIPDDGRERQWTDFRKELHKVISARLAPIPVTLVPKQPSVSAVGGVITLRISYERTNYGGPTDIHGQNIPVSMTMHVVVSTNRMAGPIDGDHEFTVRQDTPNQVSMMQLISLRDDQEKALYALMSKQVAGLPAIADASALSAAMATAAARPAPPAWRLDASAVGKGDAAARQTGLSYSYKSALADLTVALSKKLEGAQLLTTAAGDAPAGTIVLRLQVDESTYGSSMGSIKTANGALPIRMTLHLDLKPIQGTTRSVTLVADIPPPESIGKSNLDDARSEQSDRLIRELVAQMAQNADLAP